MTLFISILTLRRCDGFWYSPLRPTALSASDSTDLSRYIVLFTNLPFMFFCCFRCANQYNVAVNGGDKIVNM